MLVFLLASTLLHICSGQSLVTDLKISEHGANHKQRVEYDPSTKAVTYQVPKHHDILASTVIIHKPTDTMVELSQRKMYVTSSLSLKPLIPSWQCSISIP